MNYSDKSYNGLKTVRDFIRWAATCFSKENLFFGHGSDNALDEALHLVFQALNLPWDLPDNYLSARLTRAEKAQVSQLIQQRIKERKPLAYLVNQAWFCGKPYYVDERVLIPRSPIGELINRQFQPWLGNTEVTRLLDLCSGCGCIGLAAAQVFDQAVVDLLDISADALEVARINIDRHELWDRAQTIRSDLFAALGTSVEKPEYQLIISNPPYVDAEDMSDIPEEFTHEPEIGLAAGTDGLDFARIILATAANYLAADGWLVLEVGNSQWALRETFPEVPFIWPELEEGGHGILMLPAVDCHKYQETFKSRMKSNS
ncbi:MAG: 50S ribosomal protein L3 N(5)-glutamine methyltransferase [Endozoicomonas sp. (ex Botrylloides leachii)]|nr:50S ribosomal protein L3 N(5)-glutamine methyltransferase [Endozoicomonas sp. (ex Botrylloides leachii)]